jgi:hypothetical protein
MPAFNLGLSRHRCELRSKLNSLPSFLTYIQIGAPFVLLEGSDVDTALDAIERSENLRNVATRLASYKIPDGPLIMDELLGNALSKIDRNMLQTMALRTDKCERPQIEKAPSHPIQSDERPARWFARNR